MVNIREGHMVIMKSGKEGSIMKIISETAVEVNIKKHGSIEVDKSNIKITGWVMPEWMEEYRIYLEQFTCGNPIEELMNDHHTTIIGNAPRAMICVSLKGAMSMLEKLHLNGHLTDL